MATYTGTNGDDNITSDADIIFARKGNDTVVATGGPLVTVHGGEGADVLQVLYEQFGGRAAVMFGDDGADRLGGGFLNDTLVGGNGDDTLSGEHGDDVLEGGRGADLLDGGASLLDDGPDGPPFGGNTASYRNAAAAVRADLTAPGSNTGEAAGDEYHDISNLIGSRFNDTLVGDHHDNILEGGAGADFMVGMGAFDMASYAGAPVGVRADLANAAVNTGDAAGDSYVLIEGLLGSAFADTLAGTEGGDVLRGGAGDDLLEGRGGGDALFGHEGTDLASYAGAAAGVLADLRDPAFNTGDAAGDTYDLIEGLLGSAFADTLSGTDGSDILRGGAGELEGRGDRLEGRDGDDELVGGDASDELFGGEGADRMSGGDGDDQFHGGSGDDTMVGGAGNDQFDAGSGFSAGEVQAGADRFDGGAGIDTVYYYGQAVRADLSNPATNTGDAQGDVFVSIEHLIGSYLNDILKGTNGPETLEGIDGDDHLAGLGGADVLLGGFGADTIQGHGGNDTIEGAQGDDVLSGGASARDYFVFHEYHEREPGFDYHWGHDVITDFEDGLDRMDFRNSVEYGRDIQFSDLIITQDGADTLVTGPDDESIRLLSISASTITSADFLF
jgi:Ca2+-binding RTX toxin-like protein